MLDDLLRIKEDPKHASVVGEERKCQEASVQSCNWSMTAKVHTACNASWHLRQKYTEHCLSVINHDDILQRLKRWDIIPKWMNVWIVLWITLHRSGYMWIRSESQQTVKLHPSVPTTNLILCTAWPLQRVMFSKRRKVILAGTLIYLPAMSSRCQVICHVCTLLAIQLFSGVITCCHGLADVFETIIVFGSMLSVSKFTIMMLYWSPITIRVVQSHLVTILNSINDITLNVVT